MVYLLAWIIFTVLLLGVTLVRPHPYRIPRFLAFESILSLIFLNAGVWFNYPFSILQIISWFLLAGSVALISSGFFLIKTRGNPTGDFKDTTSLITTGVYQYIRHPLYASLLLFSLGVFLIDPSLLGAGLVASTFLGVYLTAKIEENHNQDRFGDAYQQYCAITKRFIPFIY